MFARGTIVAFASCLLIRTCVGFDLDVNNTDSIRLVAKTLASGIVTAYNQYVPGTGFKGTFGTKDEPYEYPYWESGAIWTTLLEYSHLSGDTQFDDLVSSAIMSQANASKGLNFMPEDQGWKDRMYNNDQSMWGLTALTAAETGFSEPQRNGLKWIDFAVNVFVDQISRWEMQNCAGGLRGQIFQTWYNTDDAYNAKTSFANGNLFLLAARLAQFTGNTTYSQWAERIFDWAQAVKLVRNDFRVIDAYITLRGTDKNCTFAAGNWESERDQAIFTEGVAVMYNVTNATEKWRDAVTGFFNASCGGNSCKSYNQSVDFVVRAYCEEGAAGRCPETSRSMKGLMARSYARAARAAPSMSERLDRIIRTSAPDAAHNCIGNDTAVECSLAWVPKEYEPIRSSVQDGYLGEAYSALEVVQGLLWPQAKSLHRGNASSGLHPNGSVKAGAAASAMFSPGVAFAAIVAACLYL